MFQAAWASAQRSQNHLSSPGIYLICNDTEVFSGMSS